MAGLSEEEYWKWFKETFGRISQEITEEMPDREKRIKLWAAVCDLRHQLAHSLGHTFAKQVEDL